MPTPERTWRRLCGAADYCARRSNGESETRDDPAGSEADAVADAEPAPWLSTDQAAKYLGVATRTLYRIIDTGEHPAYRFGRVIRLRRHEVEEFVDNSRIAPGTLEHLYKQPGADDDADDLE